jgi:hypothetical protein
MKVSPKVGDSHRLVLVGAVLAEIAVESIFV